LKYHAYAISEIRDVRYFKAHVAPGCCLHLLSHALSAAAHILKYRIDL